MTTCEYASFTFKRRRRLFSTQAQGEMRAHVNGPAGVIYLNGIVIVCAFILKVASPSEVHVLRDYACLLHVRSKYSVQHIS